MIYITTGQEQESELYTHSSMTTADTHENVWEENNVLCSNIYFKRVSKNHFLSE